MKKTLEREVNIDIFNIFNEIDSVIKFLQEQKRKFPDKKLYIANTTYSYDDTTMAIKYEELESDKEYNIRLDKEKNEKLKKEEQEKELKIEKERAYQQDLEKLKNKYEK